MPGIFGIISRKLAPEKCQKLVHAMLGSMLHEPFYVTGTCSAPELGIFAGWVAHPDSFAAGASGIFEDDQVLIAFSGECFSDQFRPKEKGRSGVGELAGCEAGWVAQQYREQGERCIEVFNGLFSGLIVDRRRRCAWLFNDRYGMERIYFHESDDAIYFASEAKALLRVCGKLRAFDDLGVAQFLAYGCTLDGQTLFRGVERLPGGSRYSFQPDASWRKERYFRPEDWGAAAPLTEEEFDSAFDLMFRRILKRYVKSDHGIGISLTGGLDTRMIMACLPETRPVPICYTFSGRLEQTLDGRLAARIASTCGLKHQLLRISDDFLTGFRGYLDRTVYFTDGCSGATGAHEVYFNQQARALSPVRLTGNFGSEILRGMSTFKPRRYDQGLLAHNLRRSVTEAAMHGTASVPHPVTFAAFREVPWNLFGSLAAGRSQLTFRTPYLDNEVVALAFRAPQAKRSSPLPALRFVAQNHPGLGRIPTDRGQIGNGRGLTWALRRLFAEVTFKLDYLHKEGLPNVLAPFDPLLDSLACTGVLGLHKFLPYRRWFRKELGDFLQDSLREPLVVENPFWNPEFVRALAARHISGQKNYISEINAILTLEAVQRLMFRGT